VQTLTRASNGNTTLSFNGTNATGALNFQTGTTATDVQNNLQTIAALNGRISVTGSNGGPFTIAFNNSLAGVNVPQITASTAGATIATTTQGGGNSGANTNVTVTGNPGGPFTLSFGYHPAWHGVGLFPAGEQCERHGWRAELHANVQRRPRRAGRAACR
jgi:hypothetical protein